MVPSAVEKWRGILTVCDISFGVLYGSVVARAMSRSFTCYSFVNACFCCLLFISPPRAAAPVRGWRWRGCGRLRCVVFFPLLE